MMLAASILDADFTRLGAEVAALCEVGIRRIHVDVMDGHFVPNLSVGPQVVRALRPVADACDAELNAHLMLEDPGRFVGPFADAGAHAITVHVEVASPLPRLLAQIRARGVRAGVAINPATPIEAARDVLGDADACLVMTVEPGFGGQRLIPAALEKVRQLARMCPRPRALIAVDGGVHADTIADVASAGADVAVVGSALFGTRGDVASNVARLRRALGRAVQGERT
jgi:ribulose-phosphate 3-epimerase